MKFLDAESKKRNDLTRNFFFACTLCVVVVNILLYGLLGNNWESLVFTGNEYRYNFMNTFFSNFSHANWQHVLLNMTCFFVCGLYLERKLGTLRFLALIVFLCFFGGMATIATRLARAHGFSVVNYALYGFLIVGYAAEFGKAIANRRGSVPELAFGGVVVALIVLACFFNGGTRNFSFAPYPYDLMQSVHWPGFVVGTLTGLFLQIPWKGRARQE